RRDGGRADLPRAAAQRARRRAADRRPARRGRAPPPAALGQHDVQAAGVTLPEAARWVEIDRAKGYVVEEIGDGLHWVSDGPYQAMVLVTRRGVTIDDA